MPDTPLQFHPSCNLCALHDQGEGMPRSVGIGAIRLNEIRPTALLYVGQNPGYDEDRNNAPFIGRSGQLLRRVYIDAIDARSLATVYLTNAVRCHTLHNAPPTAKPITACVPYLKSDLAHILNTHERTIVILLGAVACASFTQHIAPPKQNLKSIRNNQPQTHTYLNKSFQLLATYHPAFILRKKEEIHTISGHNDLLLATIHSKLPTQSKPTITAPGLPPPN